MRNDKALNSYLHLHFIVFIWGFTAVLGKLISLEALDLVWFRMLFAITFMAIYVVYKKESLKISPKVFIGFMIAGVVIAVHWLAFYQAIKVSNISITLSCMSTGAFFASILEPIFYKRKIIWYELLFGVVVVVGLAIIFNVETKYKEGIILAVSAAFLSALFSVINGKYAKIYNPNIISFYELGGGLFFLTLYLLFTEKLTHEFLTISMSDFLWLLVLSSFCTAYAFSASVKVMKYLSPYTVMLTINLEPIYGIILALLVFNDKEKMSFQFYIGALIILATVILNGILKNREGKNNL